jgi:hypothetical protein
MLLCGPAALAQDVTESSLKTAFIHNFVKFTVWPPDVLPPAAPLVACVLGDAAFVGVLANHVKGHPVDGHAIVVSGIASDGMLRSCHLLYVTGIAAKAAARAVSVLADAPVLTLSDVDQFARIGGMAQLYVEDGTLRFRVNLNTTKRSGLQLSSRLLSLATIVQDNPNVR